jgi:ribosomal protein S18 acetylase RimI-like enzyme
VEASRVRQGRPSDRAFIVSLAEEAFGVYGDYGRFLAQWIEWPGVRTRVAEARGVAVGLAVVAVVAGPEGARADLLAIAVVASARRSGLGGALLDDAIVQSRRLPEVGLIELTVADSNEPARRLFEGRGFRYVEEEIGRYPQGQRALHMRLLL